MRDWEAAIRATAFVPDAVVAALREALGLIGTPEGVGARIVELAARGAGHLDVMPLETFAPPEGKLRAFGEGIFPPLRAAGLR